MSACYLSPKLIPDIGLVIDQYQFKEIIGKGKYAITYRTLKKDTQQEVALKMILPKNLGSIWKKEKFWVEYWILKELDHPNIISCFDCFRSEFIDKKQYYGLVLEYIKGCNLNDYLKKTELNSDQVIKIGQQLVSAVSYLHDQGLVHRDLKPDNLMYDVEQERLVLLDFGFVLFYQHDKIPVSTIDKSNHWIFKMDFFDRPGTPLFMPPELILGNTVKRMNLPKIDVWSLGACLYYLIMKRAPYDVADESGGLLEFQDLMKTRPPINWDGQKNDFPIVIQKAVIRSLVHYSEDRAWASEILELF